MDLTCARVVVFCLGTLACGPSTYVTESSPPITHDDTESTGVGRAAADGGRSATDGGQTGRSTPPRKDAGQPLACEAIPLAVYPVAPETLILLDRSGSMAGDSSRNVNARRWAPTTRAIQHVTAQHADTHAFGLMMFPTGNGTHNCTPGRTDVAPALHSAPQIANLLVGAEPSQYNATPTAQTLELAHTELTKTCNGCDPTQKMLVLITDGQPTCATPQTPLTENVAATTTALDKLARANIKTYVIAYDTAGNPALSNTMDQLALHGGTSRHMPVDSEETLATALGRITARITPCEYTLSEAVGDPTWLHVTLDGTEYYRDNGDWHLHGDTLVLDAACDILREASTTTLNVVKDCERINVI